MSDGKRLSPSKIRSELRVLRDAVELLQNNLTAALDVFSAPNKSEGQILALWALYMFLDELGIEARLLAPLRSAIADLTDSDRQGAAKPLVEVAKMVPAAVALDTLMKAGMGTQPAAREVVRAAGQAMSAEQLITFRKNLQRGRARREALKMYRTLLQLSAERWGHLSKQDRIREALLGVQSTHRAL